MSSFQRPSTLPAASTSVRFPFGDLRQEGGRLTFRSSDDAYSRALERFAPSSAERGDTLLASLDADGTATFGAAAHGSVAAVDLLAAPGLDRGARLAIVADAMQALLAARSDSEPHLVAPALLRYCEPLGGFRLLGLPLTQATLADWFRSDESAWTWCSREVLLGKQQLRPAQSYAAALQHLLLGTLLQPSLPKVERFERVLHARIVRRAAFERVLATAAPSSLGSDVEELARLLEELCRGASAATLGRLERTLACFRADALSQVFEASGNVARARELRVALARATRRTVDWRLELELAGNGKDPAASLAACAKGRAAGDPQADIWTAAVIARAVASSGRTPVEPLLDQLPPERTSEVLAAYLAWLHASKLKRRARAKDYLSAPASGPRARTLFALLGAKLALDEGAYQVAIDTSQLALGALPAPEEERASYLRALLQLMSGVASFGLMLERDTLAPLMSVFSSLSEAAMAARALRHEELADASAAWLAYMGWFCERCKGPQAEAAQLGAPAILAALGLSAELDEDGTLPKLPALDPDELFPDVLACLEGT